MNKAMLINMGLTVIAVMAALAIHEKVVKPMLDK
jgi:hypothetical protein